MEAKLFKREDDFYSLKVDGIVMATSNGMLVDHKLSLKNCEVISNGYDLDELAEEWIDVNSHKWSNNNNEVGDNYGSFKSGFQKALEILGDKKFSEEDMINYAWYVVKTMGEYASHESANSSLAMLKVWQSLQQTEFDVEIEMIQDYSNRSCKTCNLFNTNNGGKRSCELKLQSKCASFKNDETLGDFWVSNYDDESDSTIMKLKLDEKGQLILKIK
jgi:hypothetical protein